VRRLLWILLTVLTVVLVALVAQNGGAIPGLSTTDMPSLVLKVGAVVFVGALALAMFREQFSRAIESALIWVVVALLLAISYAYRYELHEVADRVMAEVVPSHGGEPDPGDLAGARRRRPFRAEGAAQWRAHHMILDTGASSVLLTQEDAKAVGLPIEVLAYTVNIDTANGRTRAAAVTLDRVLVGGIEERSIAALIAQPGQLRTSLLGMTFLNRLESWEVRGERLVMRATRKPRHSSSFCSAFLRRHAALVAGIHVFGTDRKTWMAGTGPAMTNERSGPRLGSAWHPICMSDSVFRPSQRVPERQRMARCAGVIQLSRCLSKIEAPALTLS